MPNRDPPKHRALRSILLLLVAVLTVGAALIPHGTAFSSAPGAPARVASAAPLAAPSAAPHYAPQPAVGRLTSTTVSPLPDTAANGLTTVNPTTQQVYSVSGPYNWYYGPTGDVLTAFNLTTGAPLHAPWQLADPGSAVPSAVVFVPLQQEIYIAFESANFTGGYILVVNATTWTLAANITALTFYYGFTPGFLTYDPALGDVWAENTANVSVVQIDPATNVAGTDYTLSCSFCAPVGTIAVPTNATLWVPTETNYVGVINTSTDTWESGVTWAANPSWESDIGVQDTDFGYVVISNYSATGNVEAFYPNGTLAGTEAGLGPTYATAAAFDPYNDLVYFADANYTSVTGDEIWSYFDLFGSLYQQYSDVNATYFGGNYFDSLTVYDNATGGFLVTGGSGNGSWLLAVNEVTGNLTRQLQYPSASLTWGAQVWVDTTHDVYYIEYQQPQQIVAYNLGTGAQEFTIPTYTGSYPWYDEYTTIDTEQQLVYISIFDTPDIYVFSGTNGSLVNIIALTSNVYLLSVDPIHHLLYAADVLDDDVQVVNTLNDINILLTPIVGTAPVESVAAVPATGEVALDVVPGAGNNSVELFNGSTAAPVTSFSVWPTSMGLDGATLSADAAGDLYVPLTPYDLVTVYDTATGRFVGNWSTGLLSPMGVAGDPADGLALVSGYYNNTGLLVLNLSTGATVSAVTVTSPAASIPDYANTTHTFYTPLYYSGQLAETAVVPLPSVPSGLGGTAGNTTVALSWSASTGPAGYPVTGYDIVWATAATGPWTAGPSSTTTSVTVSGLTDGTKYYFEVEAVGASGTSGTSVAASATPLGVPYPPQSLALTVGGQTTLTANWAAPAHTDGAAISNYSLDWAKSASGPWTAVNIGTGTSYELTGLTAGTTYYVKVVAWNSVGASSPSATASAATQASSGSPGGKTGTNGSSSPAGLSGTDLILIIVGVVVLIAVIGAVLMMRRRGGGAPPSAPPTSWSPPPSAGPSAPPASAPPSTPPGPPPGAQ